MEVNFDKWLKKPWITYPICFAGGVFFGLFLGCVDSGFTLVNDQKEISLDLRPNGKLPNELDIAGEWVYVAETNQKDNFFSEDFCKKRFGTVDINHTVGNEVSLSGVRKVVEDFTAKKVATNVQPQSIRWKSDNATILLHAKKLTVWFNTDDKIPRHGYMELNIFKESNSIKPGQINGTMYYLNDENKTWFRANLEIYRVGSPKAKDIEKKW